MFKKIQQHLLINHPLVWNVKVVPMTIILLSFHLIIFIFGYSNGALNFNETIDNYRASTHDDTIIFFSVLISIITIIVWLVFYFKNNSFKSFYPKNNLSLFKEWLLILFICILNLSFCTSYFFAKDYKIRSYYTKKEAIKRCNTLSEASLFMRSGFGQGDSKYVANPNYNKGENIDSITVSLGYYTFKERKYELNSTLNKLIVSFSFFDQKEDSIRDLKIKTWLIENKKDSINKIFVDYLKIANEHNLKSNLTSDKWLKLVYNYPDFVEHKIVAKFEKDYYSIDGNNISYDNDYNNYNDVAVQEAVKAGREYDNEQSERYNYDTINQYVKQIGNVKYLYNKNFVPAKILNYNYNKIADCWTNPTIDFSYLLVNLYFALALSIIIFSFRVSSGKNWLIALITTGVLGILLGVVTALFNSYNDHIFGQGNFFLIAVLIIILFAFLFLIYVLLTNKNKKISGITNNILLWLFPFFIPICYYLFINFLKWKYDYYLYNQFTYFHYKTECEFINLLKDNFLSMCILNMVFIFSFMLFLSFKIKKWKGVSEN